ncbi:MAG: hypothetical protein D6772_14025 [Bacteroidetes bacterium]|nr:MAG: hypothetical protein D6772_14025 [Bacteroidota bacterium]
MCRYVCLLLVSSLTACYYDNEEELFQFVEEVDCSAVVRATFSADIEPLLITHCIRCHRNGREDGNVNLEGYDRVKPYVQNGALIGTVNHEAGWPAMPPSGVKLPPCDIEKIRLWIADGAPNN